MPVESRSRMKTDDYFSLFLIIAPAIGGFLFHGFFGDAEFVKKYADIVADWLPRLQRDVRFLSQFYSEAEINGFLSFFTISGFCSLVALLIALAIRVSKYNSCPYRYMEPSRHLPLYRLVLIPIFVWVFIALIPTGFMDPTEYSTTRIRPGLKVNLLISGFYGFAGLCSYGFIMVTITRRRWIGTRCDA